MSESLFHDPREDLPYTPTIGMTFIDSRHDDRSDDKEYLTIIYLDDEIALLRSNEKRVRGSSTYHHRLEERDSFERQLGSGRLKRVDHDAEYGGPITAIQRRAEELEQSDGRKAKHWAEALHEAVELLTTGRDEDDRKKIPFEDIDGVGDELAQRLRYSGFVTYGDVRRATDEELSAVDGIGEKNLGEIRAETKKDS